MTDDITIPPAALEAAYNARRNGDTLEDICLAMLKAWPEAKSVSEVFTAGGDFYRPHIILPLTENSNDR